MLIGEDVVHGRRFASVDPSSPTRIVAHAHEATAAHVTDAVARAEHGHAKWSKTPAAQRAAALHRAADILRARRLELAALAVREAGKPWAEADGDVCEAIDFLVYYAEGALALDGGKPLIQLPGERNAHALRRPRRDRRDRAVELPARDRGRDDRAPRSPPATPSCSSPPSRRPRAPRRSSTRCTPAASRSTRSASCPAATRPARRWSTTRASTRSSSPARAPSACRSCRTRPRSSPASATSRSVIAEMGGKNCVIVDSDADLDDVVPALLKSAFAFAGPEVLGRLARARAPRDRRRARRAPRRRDHDAASRPGAGLRHRRPAGDRRRRPAADPALHRSPRRRSPRPRPATTASTSRRRSSPACPTTRP